MLCWGGLDDSAALGDQWRSTLDIDRRSATSLGREAVAWVEAGAYPHGGELVPISAEADAALSQVISIPPEAALPTRTSPAIAETVVEVANQTTLAAARRLIAEGLDPLILNMANGVGPGGGFLSGSRAQEEYLCRSSSLWSTINDNPMYATHYAQGNYESSDWMILSPAVPVFRDDSGATLEEPWVASFITAAAPVAHRVGVDRSADLMKQRIHRLLAIATSYGYESLVLGAWGCGAFHNDPYRVAGFFRDALLGDFDGCFRTIVFAITDWAEDRALLTPFVEAFDDQPACSVME